MKNSIKRIGALIMAIAILCTMALTVSAATVPEATIDTTRTGSIDIYKYDLTRANTDDTAAAMIDSYVSTGVRDSALEAVLDDGTVNDLGNGEQSYGTTAPSTTWATASSPTASPSRGSNSPT